MAVLEWVRLDSGLPENPKILNLLGQPKGSHTAFVYLCSLSYCGKHGTFGKIPKAALPFIHATARDAKRLVEAGLWAITSEGWNVHDWASYQPTEEYVKSRKEKASNAAKIRWDREREKAQQLKASEGLPPF